MGKHQQVELALAAIVAGIAVEVAVQSLWDLGPTVIFYFTFAYLLWQAIVAVRALLRRRRERGSNDSGGLAAAGVTPRAVAPTSGGLPSTAVSVDRED